MLEELSDDDVGVFKGDGDKKRKNSTTPFTGSDVSIAVSDGNVSRTGHKSRDLFIQLNEFVGAGEFKEWRETARWIKYEENVEEGADRWGRPHVSSLSFHSLLNLRRCIEIGVLLLDIEEKDLPQIIFRAVKTVNKIVSDKI